jgi:repressor LexA
LGDFIRDRRKALKLSQRELAAASGVSHGYIANLERGFDYATGKPTSPSMEKLEMVAKGLRVSFEELRAASKHIGDEQSIRLAKAREVLAHAGGSASGALSVYEPGILIPRPVPQLAPVAVPLAGKVGCGNQLDLHPAGYIDLPPEVAAKGDFAAIAYGDSMNKIIQEGDVLMVRRTSTAKSGQVVIANVEGEGSTCKRLKKTAHGWIYLEPESYNEEHKPIRLTPEGAIIGVVTYVHRPGLSLE